MINRTFLRYVLFLLLMFAPAKMIYGCNCKQQIKVEEVLNQCKSSIIGVADGKTYLHPNKLLFSDNQYFLFSDVQRWIPLHQEVFEDVYGFYINFESRNKCPNGHPGYSRKYGEWCCQSDGCRYNCDNR